VSVLARRRDHKRLSTKAKFEISVETERTQVYRFWYGVFRGSIKRVFPSSGPNAARRCAENPITIVGDISLIDIDDYEIGMTSVVADVGIGKFMLPLDNSLRRRTIAPTIKAPDKRFFALRRYYGEAALMQRQRVFGEDALHALRFGRGRGDS
jgi:hypothetical protein